MSRIITGTIDELVKYMQEHTGQIIKFVKKHRKIICSGSPMNSIDFKMRKKYGRAVVAPVVTVSGPYLIVGNSTHNHNKKSNKNRRQMANQSRKKNRRH